MATFRSVVIAAAILTVFTVGGFTIFTVADIAQDHAPSQNESFTQDNETLVVEYDAYQYVNKSQEEFTTGFNNTTVRAFADGSELTRGTDYAWNTTDGTIIFHNTAATTEGENASVTYDYYRNTERVQEASGPLMIVVEAVGWLGVAGAGFAIVVLLIAVGGFIVQRVGASGPETRR